MAAFENMTAQLVCDYSSCPNTVTIRNGGIQRVRRTARDSFDWAVIGGEDICPNHKGAAQRKLDKKKEEENAR